MNKNLTRADLHEAAYKCSHLSRAEAGQLVETILDEMRDQLVSGNDVKLTSFGSFVVRDKNGRVGRNPKTGETHTISPRRVVSFKPSKILIGKINRQT